MTIQYIAYLTEEGIPKSLDSTSQGTKLCPMTNAAFLLTLHLLLLACVLLPCASMLARPVVLSETALSDRVDYAYPMPLRAVLTLYVSAVYAELLCVLPCPVRTVSDESCIVPTRTYLSALAMSI
jgi:hypothetical protein